MKVFSNSHLRITLTYFLFWIVAIYFLIIIRFLGHSSVVTNPINEHLPVDVTLLFRIGLFGALVIGISLGFLEIVFEKRLFRNMSYGKLIFIKSIIYTFIFALALILLSIQNQQISQGYFDFELWKKRFSIPNLLVWISYMAFASVLLNFTKEVSLKFGPGNLWRMLTGKFHRPQQEEKILMFLDLKSSTMIAEKLGHIKYSELIQDCFNDLVVISEYQAEVYQYVGDEAILSWDVLSGIKNNNCIMAYYAFKDILSNRSDYYLDRYGLVPIFKAGMNLGKVTIAEVGRIKKEIAFHGDTVNIAARIQDKCNEFGNELLISENLERKLINRDNFRIEELGKILLKGKQEKISLYSIHREVSIP